MADRVLGWLSALGGAVLVCVLLLLTVGQPWLGSAYQNLSLLSNAALLPISLVLAGAWVMILRKPSRRPAGEGLNKRDWLMIALFQLLLLVVQLVAARSLWFYAGWDVESVYVAAGELAHSGSISNAEYFQLCPNNAPIAALLSAPLWVAEKLGMAVPYGILPYVGACVNSLTCLLSTLCAWRLTHRRSAMWSCTALMTVWVGVHLYMTVPYTDAYGILFPVLGLYVLLTVRPATLRWGLFTLCCFFGASLKPSAVIVFIAAAMISGIGACRRRPSWKHVLCVVAAVTIGLMPATLWKKDATVLLAGSTSPDGQLPATHYVMMGQNTDSLGGHSPDDVAFTLSFDTLSEKYSANLARAWERVVERGVAGNAHFYAVKAFKAFNDGSFAANNSLLRMEVPKRTDALSTAFRAVYYARGALNGVYESAMQALWLMVLLLCAAAAFLRRRERWVAILSTTVLGLLAYLLLTEVWPRYLYLYAPLFALMAMLGAQALASRLTSRKAASIINTEETDQP